MKTLTKPMIFLLLFFITGLFFAREITFNEAQIVAENWTEIIEEKFDDQARVIDGKEIIKQGRVVAFVFDLYPKGYVVVSGHDFLPPIKMYSTEADFINNGNPFINTTFNNLSSLISKVEKKALENSKYFGVENRKNFKRILNRTYLSNDLASAKSDPIEEVKPLLSTKWHQTGSYNLFTPVIDGIQTPAGCVAAAYAQVINYYEWPKKGVGTHSYFDNWSDLTLSTNFNKEYKWWLMTDSYTHLSSEESRIAVSELMYDVGIAVEMGYATWGSGAGMGYDRQLIDNLLYSEDMKDLRRKDYPNDKAWFNVAKNQIDNGWPIPFSVCPLDKNEFPHAVVIDGYQVFENNQMVHINFGWGGSHNGYYTFNGIDTGHLEYLDWQWQNLYINFYPYPEYQRPVGLPPKSITGSAVENRGVFLKEYICTLSWSETPSEDKRIDKYVIYRQKNGEIEALDYLTADNKSYEFKEKNPGEYTYSIGVIDKNEAYSDIPRFISLQIK